MYLETMQRVKDIMPFMGKPKEFAAFLLSKPKFPKNILPHSFCFISVSSFLLKHRRHFISLTFLIDFSLMPIAYSTKLPWLITCSVFL